MAQETYAANNLVSSVTTIPATLRIFPTSVHPKTLAAVAGAPTYDVGTPFAFNTSTKKWVVWTNGGAAGTGTILGFLAEKTTVDATDPIIANMIMGGKLHFADIPVPSGETRANMMAALIAGTRALGFDIEGIDGAQYDTTVGGVH